LATIDVRLLSFYCSGCFSLASRIPIDGGQSTGIIPTAKPLEIVELKIVETLVVASSNR
jgi:hypothetical protein